VPSPGTLTVYLAVAAAAAAVLVRGVRCAALAMLAVEACSLLFIVVLILLPSSAGAAPPGQRGGARGAAHRAGGVVLAGRVRERHVLRPGGKAPLTTVTRVVLVTPLICGGLFLFAGWAAWTGRGATMLSAATSGRRLRAAHPAGARH